MDKQHFFSCMAKTASLTRDSIDDATYNLYWDKFCSWTNEEFTAATDWCSVNLRRFPTAADIRKQRPVKSGQHIEDARRWGLESAMLQSYDHGNDPDVESEIASMSDGQVADCFVEAGCDVGVDWLVKQFRANPSGQLFGWLVRESVKRKIKTKVA